MTNQQILQLLQQAFHSLQNGNIKDALTICQKAKNVSSKHPAIHNTFGLIYLHENDFEKAVQAFKTALKYNKNDHVIWANYANALTKINKPSQALSAYKEAYKLYPNDYGILNNLSEILISLKKLDHVEKHLRKAIELDNSRAEAFHNLGLYFDVVSKHEKAIEAYEQAIIRNNNSVLSYVQKANTMCLLDRYDDAIAVLEKLIERHPIAIAFQKLGLIYIKTGNGTRADQLLRSAIEMGADEYCFQNLAYLNTISKDDPIIQRMIDRYNSTTSQNEKKILGFGLAHILDQHGQYTESFKYLSEANKLKRKELTFSISKEISYFEKIENHFSATNCKSNLISQTQDVNPIFILGMPRSGSTLVEQILASCDGVYGAGEIDDLEKIIQRASPSFTKGNMTLTNQNVKTIAHSYVSSMLEKSNGFKIFTDKHLENIKYIGVIKQAFPNAKIIHCLRNPMDMCFSIYMQNFQHSVPFSFDLEEIGQYYHAYKKLMAHWKSIFGDDIFDLSYEKMVNDQETETRKLLKYCGIEFTKKSLEFYKTKRIVKTASYTQVRNPIYKNSVERWKNYKTELAPLAKYI